ncbi:MAG: hypothetical protein II863_12040, partial [Kiritimatiellae bacterium]|nr:hypothetical protein [Kiritimatiellia bacterium]
MTRRGFCLAAVAGFGAGAPRSVPAADGRRAVPRRPGKRWYKGNLHCHTYWSDGAAFPDQAVREYRDAGYDFCAVTDHNRMGENRNFWRKVESNETGWPPTVCRRN